MTVPENDKYVLVGDADLNVTLARRVYGLFVSQPLIPYVGLEFWLSGCAIVNDGVCGSHWVSLACNSGWEWVCLLHVIYLPMMDSVSGSAFSGCMVLSSRGVVTHSVPIPVCRADYRPLV